MADDLFPEEGEWHQDYTGRLMQPGVCDHEDGVLEVDPFEGEIAAFDPDSRNRLKTHPSEATEPWSGPCDDPVADDTGNTETPVHLTDCYGQAHEMDPED